MSGKEAREQSEIIDNSHYIKVINFVMMMVMMMMMMMMMIIINFIIISNGSRTEWSPIQSVII